MIKKLNELKSGETGVLASYGSGGDLELKRHLLGMGFSGKSGTSWRSYSS